MANIVTQHAEPAGIVDAQLCAYNARDLDAYCSLFAVNVTLFSLNTGEEFVRGIDAFRSFYAARFSNPSLHCRVINRIKLGKFVIDREQVKGIEEELLDVVAIYEVHNSLIRTVRFIKT